MASKTTRNPFELHCLVKRPLQNVNSLLVTASFMDPSKPVLPACNRIAWPVDRILLNLYCLRKGGSLQLSEMLLCPSCAEVFLFVGFLLACERAHKLHENGPAGAVSGRKTFG